MLEGISIPLLQFIIFATGEEHVRFGDELKAHNTLMGEKTELVWGDASVLR